MATAAEPLLWWLDNWLTEDVGFGEVAIVGDNASPEHGENAHAEIIIGDPRGPQGSAPEDERGVKWLLAEAWWAERFPAPSARATSGAPADAVIAQDFVATVDGDTVFRADCLGCAED